MATSLDSLEREAKKLRRLLDAQLSGLPARLVVMVTGKHPDPQKAREDAIASRLSAYGLTTEDEALDAGCEIVVVALPWLVNRDVRSAEKTVAGIGVGVEDRATKPESLAASRSHSHDQEVQGQ